MTKSKKLAAVFTAAVALSMFAGTSAFADSRHRDATRSDLNRGRQSDSRRYDNRGNQTFQGRVNRVQRYNSGYRVWLDRAPSPFFISASRWNRFPVRVGVNIRLGGYWDPAGYYNVNDVGPYATAGDLHGIVESVDYRRGTMVLRDDVSGSFVTVVLSGNDPRLGDLRTGDYVALSGAWNRSGVFNAYNVDRY